MIVCPNCNHQNPEGATQCEACYTSLPKMTSCPNCGAPVQIDATFCGQCGFNLKSEMTNHSEETPQTIVNPPPETPEGEPEGEISEQAQLETSQAMPSASSSSSDLETPVPSQPIPPSEEESFSAPPQPLASPGSSPTQLQVQGVKLLHVQTSTSVEIPQYLSVIHIGKPNDQIPPDVDVSGFPNSEIVSRVHADIRVEGDTYYIEDVGSSNGTYINHTPLLQGNRHRLRPGDRIALGKGDKMTFIFQLS